MYKVQNIRQKSVTRVFSNSIQCADLETDFIYVAYLWSEQYCISIIFA